MVSSNFILSIFGWSFVPDFATRNILHSIYTSSYIPIAPPQQGSRQHRKHYAITFACVILAYLSYTLYESASAVPPNFYQILGVPPDVDENGLKLAFRAFAKRNHPDRPDIGQEGAELFMVVRDAFEALKDPVVRFAYDRFGPNVLGWRQQCKTPREFLRQGLLVSSGYHLVAGIALLFWSAIGKPSPVSFWRYVLFGALFAAELSFILSPFPASPSNIFPPPAPLFLFGDSASISLFTPSTSRSFLQIFFPNRVPYQHILLLHQIFLFFSVALSRVVPQFVFLFSDDASVEGKKLQGIEREIWQRIYETLAVADREASIILHTILASVNPASSSVSSKSYHEPTLAKMRPVTPAQASDIYAELTPEIQNLIIEANIKNQIAGPVNTAWTNALRNAKPEPSTSTTDSARVPPATRDFWQKDLAASEVVIVDSAMFESREIDFSESELHEVSSTPRLGRRKSSLSPIKGQSPVRSGGDDLEVETEDR